MPSSNNEVVAAAVYSTVRGAAFVLEANVLAFQKLSPGCGLVNTTQEGVVSKRIIRKRRE